jgi:molybdopterin molybdotransferase
MMASPIPVEEARRQILDAVPPLQPIELPLAEAYGSVAAADVVTDYDIPPFTAALVEGFAARSADIVAAGPATPVGLRRVGRVATGRPPEVTVGWGEAVRVVVGSPIPAGADCVIPGGGAVAEGDGLRVTERVEANRNLRVAGEDIKAGSVLVPSGRRLSSPELAVLATAGYGSVPAFPRVRVGVLSAGDLVEPGRPAGFGQIRDACSYLLLGALRDVGAVPYRIGIVADEPDRLREAIASNSLRVDAFVVSGGSLRPDGSVVRAVSRLGEIRTLDVAAHPGSELAVGNVEGRPYFSVSGKPASAYVSFETFVRPAILKMMGRRDLRRPEVSAVLDATLDGPHGVMLFVPARLTNRDGTWHVVPTGPAAEELLGSVVEANGLIAAPPGELPKIGDRVRVHVVRPLER